VSSLATPPRWRGAEISRSPRPTRASGCILADSLRAPGAAGPGLTGGRFRPRPLVVDENRRGRTGHDLRRGHRGPRRRRDRPDRRAGRDFTRHGPHRPAKLLSSAIPTGSPRLAATASDSGPGLSPSPGRPVGVRPGRSGQRPIRSRWQRPGGPGRRPGSHPRPSRRVAPAPLRESPQESRRATGIGRSWPAGNRPFSAAKKKNRDRRIAFVATSAGMVRLSHGDVLLWIEAAHRVYVRRLDRLDPPQPTRGHPDQEDIA
jgi:hypothetical protein